MARIRHFPLKAGLLWPGVLALCLASCWPATALAFDRIVVFGDSLTDNGPEDGYGLRISSNGRVWADYLAERMGVGLLDMAYSSAQTDYHPVTGSAKWGFCWQIDEYLHAMGPVSSQTLYIIWIGGNDLLKRSGDPRPVIDKAITNIELGINRLIGAGARQIMVMNLPNLGLTPLMNGQNLHMNGQGLNYKFVDNPGGGTRMAAAFNSALKGALAPYHNSIELFEIDVFALTNRFVAANTFDNSTHMLMVNQPTADAYMFWDTHHPTDDAHRLIAEAVYGKIATEAKSAAILRLGDGRDVLAATRRQSRVP